MELINCPQLAIYLALSVVSIVTSLFLTNSQLRKMGVRNVSHSNVLMQILSTMIGYFLLHWLCANGHSTIAWVVLFFPVIVAVLGAIISLL